VKKNSELWNLYGDLSIFQPFNNNGALPVYFALLGHLQVCDVCSNDNDSFNPKYGQCVVIIVIVVAVVIDIVIVVAVVLQLCCDYHDVVLQYHQELVS
jgi:uncharacterized protein (DUF983 family)